MLGLFLGLDQLDAEGPLPERLELGIVTVLHVKEGGEGLKHQAEWSLEKVLNHNNNIGNCYVICRGGMYRNSSKIECDYRFRNDC